MINRGHYQGGNPVPSSDARHKLGGLWIELAHRRLIRNLNGLNGRTIESTGTAMQCRLLKVGKVGIWARSFQANDIIGVDSLLKSLQRQIAD